MKEPNRSLISVGFLPRIPVLESATVSKYSSAEEEEEEEEETKEEEDVVRRRSNGTRR